MKNQGDPPHPPLPVEFERKVDHVCRQFESAWRLGHRPSIEEYLGDAQGPLRAALLVELFALELEMRIAAGERPTIWQYKARFLADERLIQQVFAEYVTPAGPRLPQATPLRPDDPFTANRLKHDRAASALRHTYGLGRYRIVRKLGAGRSGQVFLAQDQQMVREVAIKVAYDRSLSAKQIAQFLEESRRLTQLHHPALVPVYEIGLDETGRRFVVSRYVPGPTIAARMQAEPPDLEMRVAWVAEAAEGLQHAHDLGLLHRDVRPGNIVLDQADRAALLDFALPPKEPDSHRPNRPVHAAHPARPDVDSDSDPDWQYLSPEQRAGEEHRVGRPSDVFALGAVLQWLIAADDARQDEPTEAVPAVLRQIARRATAPRAADRFASAAELAGALRRFLAGEWDERPRTAPIAAFPLPESLRPLHEQDAKRSSAGDQRRAGGIEADRPSAEFWSRWILSQRDDDSTDVSLLYGPAGAGKTSLVRARLLPLLPDDILPVYVTASCGETQQRLLAALRKRVPGMPERLDAVAAVAAIRRGTIPVDARRVVLIIDQLDRLPREDPADWEALVPLLRQCSTPRLSCLLVADAADWYRLQTLFAALEIELRERTSCRIFEPPTPAEATRALELRRAEPAAPSENATLSESGSEQLDEVRNSLVRSPPLTWSRVVMMGAVLDVLHGDINRWTTRGERTDPALLYLDVVLEEVLRALSGAERRAARRWLEELAEDAPRFGDPPHGAATESAPATEILGALEMRWGIIEPREAWPHDGTEKVAGQGIPAYRLSHEFLRGPLREWLRRQNLRTSAGRAREMLAIYASADDPRGVPSTANWLKIHLQYPSGEWNEQERATMRIADRHHLPRLAGLAAAGLALAGALAACAAWVS